MGLAGNWSARAEWDAILLQNQSFTVSGSAFGIDTITVNNRSINMFTAALNYKLALREPSGATKKVRRANSGSRGEIALVGAFATVCRHRRNYRRLNGKLLKVNNSLATDRTVPNMQRLRTISRRQTKDVLQPQKRTPTEKMFKTWATLGQPAKCHESSLRWSFVSNIKTMPRSGHSWPRMATSASIVAIFASFVALLWLFLHLL